MTIDAAALLDGFRHSWIDGAPWVARGEGIPSINPATGLDQGLIDDGGGQAADIAVMAARDAFNGGWGRLRSAERSGHLLAWAERIAANIDQLAWLETLEVGRPITDARALVSQGPGLVRYCASLIGDLAVRADGVARRPRGVVGAITPWNFPVANVLVRAAPILAAGNCLVLKPSELSPRSAVLLGQLASEAGLPAGVFNVVLGRGDTTGAALAAHSDVDMITFTGSTQTGRAIAQTAASLRLKPVALECGGKSAQIVAQDMIDEDEIWPAIFWSAFWNTGQWCASRSRLLVPSGKLHRAVAGLAAAAEAWRVGDPSDPTTALGPLASSRQHRTVAGYRETARAASAHLVLPCPLGMLDPRGFFVCPELILNPGADAPVWREETFGPLLAVQEYADIDEAVGLAEASDYGLASTLWTADRNLAEAVAERLTVGSVDVMTTPQAKPGLGSGGYFEPRKQSGYGVDGGFQGMAAYTAPQAITYVS
ncbi:aldehyde dehydrogenase [Phenylobacterium sp.]|uniref:aldehyde dehydrogenase family protein n=1 Tax=Phenylobacterium sp. TaxID=1871053 RepID=UPI0035690F0C